ncbi:hypothetical protein FIBSPDRAFT_872914 [Athelia psychrophila]|uniref:Uncharacterized protein n=1 Tax=Athelia psychrophila TaxID=1759441 RepID=A0A165Z2Q1_9AGAM|nr:hypothetical protein FIBSPDRAFT_872914 [Fibularhizoctonia sp. CBS 109695]
MARVHIVSSLPSSLMPFLVLPIHAFPSFFSSRTPYALLPHRNIPFLPLLNFTSNPKPTVTTGT